MRLPGESEPKVPKHPFRDTAILYGVLAAVIVIVSVVTGGGVAKGVVIGIAFFVVATGWSWWRFRERIEQEEGER
jgi:hypothetical protein